MNIVQVKGSHYTKTRTEFDNGGWLENLSQENGDSTITTVTLGFLDGTSKFIETETDGYKKRVSIGYHDKDYNLTSLYNEYYENDVLRHLTEDANADGNLEYEAMFNIDGSFLLENFDPDSDGVAETQKYYFEDGTYDIIDNRNLQEKAKDFWSSFKN